MVAAKATTWRMTKTETTHVSPFRGEPDPKKEKSVWSVSGSGKSEKIGGGIGGGLMSMWVSVSVDSAIGFLSRRERERERLRWFDDRVERERVGFDPLTD